MKLKTLSPWAIDVLAAVIPAGGLLAVCSMAELVRVMLPEPFGYPVGGLLAVGGAWFFAWCVSPVPQKETS